MTVTATTTAQQPLGTRIENLIRAAMDRRFVSQNITLARALKDANNEVAGELQAEASGKGWTATEVEALRHLVCMTGARIARRLVSDGLITREQLTAN
jgi:hypothetical protein